METLREFTHLLFEMWSCRVVSTEESGLGYLIWESVVLTHAPSVFSFILGIVASRILGIVASRILAKLGKSYILVILLLNRRVENCWRRVLDLDIFVKAKFLPQNHQLVHDLVVDLCIYIGHVATEWLEQMSLVVFVESIGDISVQTLDKIVKLVVTLIFIECDW